MGLFTRKRDKQRAHAAATAAHPDAAAPGAAPASPSSAHMLAEFDAVIEREMARLAAPGTWLTGAERVAIARVARVALLGDEDPGVGLSETARDAAHRVAVHAATIRPHDVAWWEGEGLDRFAYVELTGIVSRLAAIDVASFGLGRRLPTLPEPEPGEPTRSRPDDATTTTGWVPTLGPASAPSSLSAVPAEKDAMFDLHGVLYASMEEMLDLQLERDGMTRPQLELVAARTSRLNDCFY